MVSLPEIEIIDIELYAGTTLSFDLRFWLDDEKTQPNNLVSLKCSIYSGSTELLDLDEYTTIDENNANIVYVSVPPEETVDLKTQIAQWQAIATFTSGEVRPVFKGRVQIWGRKVD